MRGRPIFGYRFLSTTSRSTAKLTNGEDLADLGEHSFAYLAWKEDTKDKAGTLGWVTPSNASSLLMVRAGATNERDENKRLRATMDPHSPENIGPTVGFEHERISSRVPLQAGSADGARKRMPCVVAVCRK